MFNSVKASIVLLAANSLTCQGSGLFDSAPDFIAPLDFSIDSQFGYGE